MTTEELVPLSDLVKSQQETAECKAKIAELEAKLQSLHSQFVAESELANQLREEKGMLIASEQSLKDELAQKERALHNELANKVKLIESRLQEEQARNERKAKAKVIGSNARTDQDPLPRSVAT